MEDILSQQKEQTWISCKNKKWIRENIDDTLYQHLVQQLSLSDLTAQLLAQKNITPEKARQYLDPKLKDHLPHPFSLKNMEALVDRLYKAFLAKEKITVFGDYDVDGATSTALLVTFFRQLNFPLDFYIPDRFTEGYGPTIQAFERIRQSGSSLIITVDCGTTALEALKYANSNGLDVLVIDHHTCNTPCDLPHVWMVNPNQPGDSSDLKYLAAVGVTFMVLVGFVHKLKKEKYTSPLPDLRAFLDIVALGTVCDIVPLIDLNRALVKQGLSVFKKQPNLGLKQLAHNAGITSPLDTYHLGFILGPRINAGGRLKDSTLGVKLLTTQSIEEAEKLSLALCALNQERQYIENEIFQEAIEQVHNHKLYEKPIICVHAHNWHQGVIGIIASRLKEHFNKPTCVISFDSDGVGKGSGRSVKGLHLGNLILSATQKNFLLTGGGHAMAAGFSLNSSQLPDFYNYLTTISSHFSEEHAQKIQAVLSLKAINDNALSCIDALAPFGCENPKPKILVPYVHIKFIQKRGENHLSCTLKSEGATTLQGIAFRALQTPLKDALMGHQHIGCHVIGTLKEDYWKGHKKIVFQIEDCIPASS